MTITEACDLVVDVTRELSAVRAERDAWRFVARAAINHGHDIHIELDRLRARYHQLLDERRQRRQEAA
jgi:hypothetical protein